MPHSYPAFIQNELESIRMAGGVKVVSDDSFTYVLLALGERRTGGYSIEIEEVVEQIEQGQTIIVIRAKEIKPPPDALVIQVLTYPTLVYRLPYTVLPIKVEWVRAF